jgi:hypothetical protein
MADPIGIGVGAGGGVVLASVVYFLDKILGSGKTAKAVINTIEKACDELKLEIAHIKELEEKNFGFMEKQMQGGVDKLTTLLSQLIKRFDDYNDNTKKLIYVIERLERDLSDLKY